MIVEVTMDDIGFGKRGSANDCAVAQALRRYYPKQAITVIPTVCTINNKSFYLPPIATKFILAFDNNQPVGPVKFYLNTEKYDTDNRQKICSEKSLLV